MTKSEQRECDSLTRALLLPGLGPDYVARGLSALIRAARTERSRAALLEWAQACPGVTRSPEFII